MNVIVVGCGRVGSGLAVRLDQQGHQVCVIDRRAESFRKLPTGFGGKTVVGVGFDRDRLRTAGIESANAVAAVTSGDNSNIMIARVAREAFGIERVVARIYDPKRAVIYERLGVPTVATVSWTIDRVMRKLDAAEAEAAWVDPTAAVSLVERFVPRHWAGRPIAAMERDLNVRAVSLARLGTTTIADPDRSLQEGDIVWVALATESIESFDAALNAVPEAGGHH